MNNETINVIFEVLEAEERYKSGRYLEAVIYRKERHLDYSERLSSLGIKKYRLIDNSKP